MPYVPPHRRKQQSAVSESSISSSRFAPSGRSTGTSTTSSRPRTQRFPSGDVRSRGPPSDAPRPRGRGDRFGPKGFLGDADKVDALPLPEHLLELIECGWDRDLVRERQQERSEETEEDMFEPDASSIFMRECDKAFTSYLAEGSPVFLDCLVEKHHFGADSMNDRFFDSASNAVFWDRRAKAAEHNNDEKSDEKLALAQSHRQQERRNPTRERHRKREPFQLLDQEGLKWADYEQPRWLKKYKREMENINDAQALIIPGKIRRFGDVCCAPGGFSAWLLDHLPDEVCGHGVTISEDPPEDAAETGTRGGFQMMLPNCDRFRFEYRDVTDRPHEIEFHGGLHRCDFVVCDGNILTHRDKNSDDVPSELRRRIPQVFHFSRVLAAVQNVAEGGDMLLRIKTRLSVVIVEIVCALRCVFRDVLHVIKPQQGMPLHLVQSQGYLLLRDFDLAAFKRVKLRERMMRALERLHAGDDDEGAAFMLLNTHPNEELRIEHPTQITEKYGEYLRQVFEPAWEVQVKAYRAIRAENERLLARRDRRGGVRRFDHRQRGRYQ